MKKVIATALAACCLFCLAGCSDSPIADLSKTAKIEIISYDLANGEESSTIAIAGEEDIKRICDNLNSLTLKKMENTDPTILEYRLTFYNADGEQLEAISIPVNDWMGCNGYFYSITGGELNRAYIAELIDISLFSAPAPTPTDGECLELPDIDPTDIDGTYQMLLQNTTDNSKKWVTPILTISTDNKAFELNGFAVGNYEVDGNILTCKADNGEQYVFTITDTETLSFIKNSSAELKIIEATYVSHRLPETMPVEDGATFKRLGEIIITD